MLTRFNACHKDLIKQDVPRSPSNPLIIPNSRSATTAVFPLRSFPNLPVFISDQQIKKYSHGTIFYQSARQQAGKCKNRNKKAGKEKLIELQKILSSFLGQEHASITPENRRDAQSLLTACQAAIYSSGDEEMESKEWIARARELSRE